jgi:hypothetical protein
VVLPGVRQRHRPIVVARGAALDGLLLDACHSETLPAARHVRRSHDVGSRPVRRPVAGAPRAPLVTWAGQERPPAATKLPRASAATPGRCGLSTVTAVPAYKLPGSSSAAKPISSAVAAGWAAHLLSCRTRPGSDGVGIAVEGWRRRLAACAALVLVFIAALWASHTVLQHFSGMSQTDDFTVSASLAALLAGAATASGLTRKGNDGPASGDAAADKALQQLVDRLAPIVRLEYEAQERQLTGSGLLPVSWLLIQAGASPPLEASAARPPGWPASQGDADWPGNLAALFQNLHQKQLIILGEPGSGKTTIAVSLLLRLISARGPADPLPVRFSIGSWNPRVESLHAWLWRRLVQDYPELEPRFSSPEISTLHDALTKHWIIPILDGFDEIRDADLRNYAVDAIRKQQGSDLPMIITSRMAEFNALTRSLNSFPGATVVSMQPLRPEQALTHLAATAPDGQRELWDGVLLVAANEGSAPLASALASPLMVWLAGVGLDSGQVRAEDLLARKLPPGRDPLEKHLLAALVPGAFAVALRRPLREDKLATRDPAEATRWLTFLARRLQRHNMSEIAWWQLQALAPLWAVGCGIAAAIGLIVGLLAGASALLAIEADLAALLGLLFGFGFGQAYSAARLSGAAQRGRRGFGGRSSGADTDFYVFSRKFLFGLAMTLAFAIAAAAATSFLLWRRGEGLRSLAAANGKPGDLLAYSFIGGVIALLSGLAGGTIAGILLRSNDTLDKRLSGARSVSPAMAVRKDRFAAIGAFVVGTVVSGVLAFVILRLAIDRSSWSMFAGAVAGGITASLMFTWWPFFRMASAWFAIRNQLPWNLMSFLEEALDYGVLRQTGIAYKFRHDLLQESLIKSAAP